MSYKDLVTGILLTLLGFFISLYAAYHYEIGSLRNMGPGYFPLVLAILLSLSGLSIAAIALLKSRSQSGDSRNFNFRSFLSTIAAITLFAFLIYPLGIFLATMILAVVSLITARDLSLGRIALIAIGLAIFSWLVFKVGLKMPLPVFPSW